MTLSDKLYKILIQGGSWKTILTGLWVTIKISFLALLLGTVLGTLVCLLRTRKNPLARGIASIYIAILRGTPVLMLLLLLYYGVFARAGLTPLMVAVVTFALNVSAHVAELLRAALDAADRGQAEAARTLGFSAWDAFRLVTLPQVLRIAKPVYQSTIVNLIQWTSVVGYVTSTDLTRVINNIASRTMQPLLTISIGMLIYLALSYLVFGIFALSDKITALKRGGEAV
jgi:polar amino acid transport system permease protein/polar amino acid transport system substrate-binding protein